MESTLHIRLKETVVNELRKEGYKLYLEPPEPPVERLMWDFYRPDVLGVMFGDNLLKLTLTECETNPSRRRMANKTTKIKRSFIIQKRFNEKHLLRLLLVVPTMMLNRINHFSIRRLWEIWIVNNRGRIIQRVPQLEN